MSYLQKIAAMLVLLAVAPCVTTFKAFQLCLGSQPGRTARSPLSGEQWALLRHTLLAGGMVRHGSLIPNMCSYKFACNARSA
jgi:hypothetical protein